ncbi:hypothetical protein D6855_07370 [Butyrivibrio sp. CB08]|uniref:hypothetical protein n=1 Tax=Butyrivibrio sp. CB08 TaxID=2364879 RepID=UPI000EAA07E9|nr:hypothetical protein [Butyrivibrio sp. CB08]RKM60521.1 hypothetical protein D6855_07370 [Butyrivibrio sp. CB08]
MKKNKLIITRILAAAVAAAMLFCFPAKGSIAYAENDNKVKTENSSEKENVEEKTDVEEEQADEEEEEELSDYDRALKEAADARHALQNDPNHIHHYRWIAKRNASESADGTINYMCEECDKVWFFRPYPAYYCFQGDIARQIEVAPENFTIKVKTSLYINFNKQVMEALAKRPDVSLQVSFLRKEYTGDRLSFTIPAGEDTMSLLDENGYTGFIFLGNKYGMTLEVKHEIDEEEAAETVEETNKEAAQE